MSKPATLEKPQDGTLVPMHPTSAPAVAPTGAGSLMTALIAAANNPECNPEKMLAMHALFKEIRADESERLFNDAMVAAQTEMRRIGTDSYNDNTKSRYASYPTIDRAVRPIYTKHGFALSFGTEAGAPELFVRMVCYVTCHGHTRKYLIDMPADGKGAKGGDVMTRTHATGSATTYGRRYLLTMIFNLAIGQDDDGNAAGRQFKDAPAEDDPLITDKQVDEIRKLLADTQTNELLFLKRIRLESLTEISTKNFERAKKVIRDNAAARMRHNQEARR